MTASKRRDRRDGREPGGREPDARKDCGAAGRRRQASLSSTLFSVSVPFFSVSVLAIALFLISLLISLAAMPVHAATNVTENTTAVTATSSSTTATAAATANTTQQQADALLYKLTKEIAALGEQGYPTMRLNDSLQELRVADERKAYDEVAARYATTEALVTTMTTAKTLLDQSDALLDEAGRLGIATANASLLRTKAGSEYQIEDFEGAANDARAANALLLPALKQDAEQVLADAAALERDLAATNLTLTRPNETLVALRAAYAKGDYGQFFLLAEQLGALNDSARALITLRGQMDALAAQGRTTARFQDILAGMRQQFEQKDDAGLLAQYNATELLVASINGTLASNEATRARIAQPALQGIDFSEAEQLLNLSERELAIENYEQAASYAEQAASSVETTARQHLFVSAMNQARMRFDPLAFLRRNWWWLLLAGVLAVLAEKVGGRLLKIRLLERRIAALRKEQEAIVGLTRKLQWDYFKERAIDKDAYAAASAEYQKRADEIDEQLPLLELRLERLRERGKPRRRAPADDGPKEKDAKGKGGKDEQEKQKEKRKGEQKGEENDGRKDEGKPLLGLLSPLLPFLAASILLSALFLP